MGKTKKITKEELFNDNQLVIVISNAFVDSVSREIKKLKRKNGST